MTAKNVLFAGPWVGEFGWELFCWQGVLRRISVDYDHVIVASKPGHQYLYKDFCSEYVEYTPNSAESSGPMCKDFIYDPIHQAYQQTYPDMMWVGPQRFLVNYAPDRKYPFPHGMSSDFYWENVEQQFTPYGEQDSRSQYDLVLHPRNASKVKPGSAERNWDRQKWNLLTRKLLDNQRLRIATIGTNTAAHYVDGTTDLRGIPLSRLADILASSRLVIGPSSGPLHFASLCKCPHLVWSTEYNRIRYEQDWNPFATAVTFIADQGFDPDIELVYSHVLQTLTSTR